MRNLLKGFVTAALLAAAGCGSDGSTEAPAATDHVSYELEIDGRTVVLDLQPNDTVVARNYREYVARPDGLEEQPAGRTIPNCMYRGGARWADGRTSTGPAWSALNHCGGFSGLVAIDGETWSLEPGAASDQVLVSRLSQGPGASVRMVTIRKTAVVPPSSDSVAELSEALTTPTKYMELVIVSDAARFAELGLKAPSNALQVANLADALYRNGTLTPSIAIVVVANIVIPGDTDPWPVPAMGEVDASALLDGFTSWARPHLPPGDDYLLLTQRELLGNTVGLGWIGRTCTAHGVAVVQATSTHGTVSTILSHELGHNLGMLHDASADYVMSPNIGAPLATTWSAQSSTELAAYLASLGAKDCLNNVPEPDLSARCGDGIQDAGEQCDCGSNDCTGIDPCCNGAVCQLWPGAECSDVDGCCDACQVLAQGTVCEPATPCQPAGICSGQSGKCSAPAPYENGTACTVAGFSDGRCLQGECLSRDQQCGARTSGTVACPSGARATSCSDLACITPGATACHAWIKEYEQPPKVLEGSTCGDGQQCYQGTCVATSTIPRCESGLPVNACGGCSSLAMQPGASCNACGVSECFSGGVVCSNAACLDGFECLSGICSPIDACKAGPCQIGEVCRSTGPGTYVCDDLDECSSQNGGCDPRVSCTNALGGRVCGPLDACHSAYLCPAATTSCPFSIAPDGTACNDQNACTTADLCVAGACVGSNPVVCTAASSCQLPGTCNPSTGTCGVPVADPRCAHCSDGVKNAGELSVDCGGGDCLACTGSRCTSNAECASGFCKVNPGGGQGAQCARR